MYIYKAILSVFIFSFIFSENLNSTVDYNHLEVKKDMKKKGYIGLQDHNSSISFRNMKIRKL